MIYLINPYITSEERYGKKIDDIGGHQMPLGVYYLAAALIQDGRSVDVIDAEAQKVSHENILALFSRIPPSIVGITSTTVCFYRSRALAEEIRRHFPRVPIVIGGPHMTAMPVTTMKTNAFDYGVVCEGERSFTELVRYIVDGVGDLHAIPNLYYWKEGVLMNNPVGRYIEPMDSIPHPARHLCHDLSVYKPPTGAFKKRPVMNVMTSRGCPYECIFCDNNTFGRHTRFFSAEYVVREIKDLIHTYGAREIAFLDDTFMLRKERFMRIFELLDHEHIRFPWTCMTRVNNLDYETLAFMAAKGCWQIRIGVESGNQGVLDFIKKGITLEQVRNVTKWCAQLKICTTGFFMIGHHIDTPETIQETIGFALSVSLTDIVVTINTPIPGTESYEKARSFGNYDEKDWTALNYWTPIFIPKGLTQEFMLKKQAEMYYRFYSRPRTIIQQLTKICSWHDARMYLKSALLGLSFVKEKMPTKPM